MKKTIDILSKYQKAFLGVAIFLSLFAVSITIDNKGVNLNFKNYPALMILMVVIGMLLALVYVRIDKNRIEKLSIQIESLSTKQGNSKSNLSQLTRRQKEVYDLILSGKSNKEIMIHLFIEQSTLKSHINQIYKKLNIKSRRELRAGVNN